MNLDPNDTVFGRFRGIFDLSSRRAAALFRVTDRAWANWELGRASAPALAVWTLQAALDAWARRGRDGQEHLTRLIGEALKGGQVGPSRSVEVDESACRAFVAQVWAWSV